MGVEGVPGTAVAATAAGALLIWSGIKGRRVTDSLRAVISGQQPAGVNAYPVTASFDDSPAAAAAGAVAAGGSASGSAIAAAALEGEGAGYVWGGAPAKGRGNWDCSSFANWTLGRKLGMAIPGYAAGTYTGAAHGPTTLQYLAWGSKVPGGAAAAAPGDLCVWQTHMGIALGGGQMISALNPSLGTRVTSIAGGAPGGEVLFVRRT
jgi:cell wall-associated NlpC family hydrolase